MPFGTDDRRKNHSLRAIYNACSTGGDREGRMRLPETIVTVGANLNQMLGTTDYLPDRVYVVTPKGIEEIP